jgi:hypothetical protein
MNKLTVAIGSLVAGLLFGTVAVVVFLVASDDQTAKAPKPKVAEKKPAANPGTISVQKYDQAAAEREKLRLIQEQDREEAARDLRERQQQLAAEVERRETFDRNVELDKKLRMEEDARRIGSLSKQEYLQAKRALGIVKMRGQDGFERLPPTIVRQAALIDPDLIADMQRIAGLKRLGKN